jgi:HlyD family secretion protein
MNRNHTNQHAEISQPLHLVSRKPGKKLSHWIFWTLVVLVIAGGAIRWGMGNDTSKIQYKTQAATQGSLTVSVTATGNLQPTNTVTVGSELSGIIKTVEVDYNDRVTVGQVLARLDTTKLQTQVLQSRAAVDAARAKVLQVGATIKEARDQLSRLTNLVKMGGSKALSKQDLDAAEATLARGLADEASAKASVNQAAAVLALNETDLAKALIKSPINGIVLTRSVEPGQTVAASLQAPVLFTLAEDLARMELHVDVDEADVGQVAAGQKAHFTVDAYPERSFPAKITQVRFGSKTTSGVVTYETLLDVDNSDLSLRPGMTATADIVVLEVADVLLVPNAALRFSPPMDQKGDRTQRGGILTKLFPRPPHRPEKPPESTSIKKRQKVWGLRNGIPFSVSIETGVTDGTRTQVTQGEVKAGMELIVDTVSVVK